MNAVKKFVEYFGDYGREEMKLENLLCAVVMMGVIPFAAGLLLIYIRK